VAENTIKSFPMLPPAHWWSLRDKFKTSIPGEVSDNYIATVLKMQLMSARTNVLPFLRTIGLIDENNKTNIEMAKAWRDDDHYADVCRQIRERIYPEELMAAVSAPSKDRSAAERWFAHNTGKGTSAVGRMAQFYTVLMEADISKKPEHKVKLPAQPKSKPKAQQKPKSLNIHDRKPGNLSPYSGSESKVGESPKSPGISINLQIHISADSTPDQIDKIFESMAKHIYGK
jgi:hypothetical protein